MTPGRILAYVSHFECLRPEELLDLDRDLTFSSDSLFTHFLSPPSFCLCPERRRCRFQGTTAGPLNRRGGAEVAARAEVAGRAEAAARARSSAVRTTGTVPSAGTSVSHADNPVSQCLCQLMEFRSSLRGRAARGRGQACAPAPAAPRGRLDLFRLRKHQLQSPRQLQPVRHHQARRPRRVSISLCDLLTFLRRKREGVAGGFNERQSEEDYRRSLEDDDDGPVLNTCLNHFTFFAADSTSSAARSPKRSATKARTKNNPATSPLLKKKSPTSATHHAQGLLRRAAPRAGLPNHLRPSRRNNYLIICKSFIILFNSKEVS